MHTETIDECLESEDERRARYKRLAIAAAAAAARAPIASVRTAYLIIAESWSNLAHSEELRDAETAHYTLPAMAEYRTAPQTETAPAEVPSGSDS